MKLSCTGIGLLLTLNLFFGYTFSQNTKLDSLFANRDTTTVMDSLMKDFDFYLDSLSQPKSFFSASLGLGTGIFSFEDKNTFFITSEKKLILSPSIGYYNKSGWGLSASAFMLYDQSKIVLYQGAITPSYDLIRSRFSTGISYTRYFNKDSLDFYTTPLHNEVFAYFSYKKFWFRPGIAVSYGWGTNTEYEKEQFFIASRLLQRSRAYFVTIRNEQSVRDLSMTLSLRKNIEWYDVFGKDDNITLTPVVLLNAGTQNFGFNTSYTSDRAAMVRINSLPSNSSISETTDFALQSLSAVFKASYLKGKFLLQPQVYFDYALWDTEKRFNTVYSFVVAVSF